VDAHAENHARCSRGLKIDIAAFLFLPDLPMSRLKKYSLNVLLLIFGCTAALGLGEAMLRIWEPIPMRLEGNRIRLENNTQFVFKNPNLDKLDPVIIHSKNSIGFRGEDPPSAFEEHLTFIAIGGSTTEGFYLSDGRTWPEVLGTKLGESFNKIWINNSGLDGHSTFGHFIMMRDYIAAIKPKVVIFLIGINDVGLDKPNPPDDYIINLSEYWQKRPLQKRHPIIEAILSGQGLGIALAENSKLFSLSLNIFRAYKATQSEIGHGQIDFAKLVNMKPLPVDEGERRAEFENHSKKFLPQYEARLERLIALTRKAGIVPILLTQPALYGPAIDDVTGLDFAARSGLKWERLEWYNDVTRRVAAENNVFVIDLAVKMPKSSRFYYDWFHFTNEGAEKAVEILKKEMEPWLILKFPQFKK
jgi:lysophospholipase L1-like esterase